MWATQQRLDEYPNPIAKGFTQYNCGPWSARLPSVTERQGMAHSCHSRSQALAATSPVRRYGSA
jgi:hypothetical protein